MVILWGRFLRVNPGRTKKGGPFCTFLLQVPERIGNQNVRHNHPCVAFGTVAEIIHERFPDGTVGGVMGRLQSRPKDNRWLTNVAVTQVSFNQPGMVPNYDWEDAEP